MFSARRRGASPAKLFVFVMLLVGLVGSPSHAIQLRWAGGATDLTVSQDTQAVLAVQADSAEVSLPNSWTLQWTADSTGIRFSAFDPSQACLVDTAKVDSIIPPSTPAGSAANLIQARFCSDGSNNAATAYFLVDLPAVGYGKLKVVALDPGDTTQVIESNEVTFNGGIGGEYPSAALATTTSHAAHQFVVHATGNGLSNVTSVLAQAADSLWSLPLRITQQSSSSLTAEADVYSSMPVSVLRLTSESGAVAVARLEADGQREGVDPDFEALAESCIQHHCYYFDPDPNVYPKDFAFFYAVSPNPIRGLFHLFYIRHRRNASVPDNERSFGHAWSSDLRSWAWDTSAAVFSVSANAWDRAHVWAPSIVPLGPDNYAMFYTGVDDQTPNPNLFGNQRIGYATTAAIDTGSATVWTRRSSATYTVNHTGWAWRDSAITQPHRQQFRDPFITEDPDNAGRYLLLMVGEKQDGDYAVGVARNQPGTLDAWDDLGYYRCTEREYSGNGQTVESVTAFPDSAYPGSATSAQATWRLLFTHGIDSPDDHTIRFSTKKLGPPLADTTLGPVGDRTWSTPATNLFTYLDDDPTAWGTYATEHLRVGRVDFLATFDGAGILVSRMYWNGADFTLLQPSVLGVDGARSAPETHAALRVIEAVPGAGRVAFEIALPARERVRLGIYDVAGRRVRSLIDAHLPASTMRVQWDGKDQAGNAVRTGMYFARLSGGFGSRVARAVFIR